MSETQVFTMLKTLNIPVAYDHFISNPTTTQSPPFILYRCNPGTNFKADDKVYYKIPRYIIDLVTDLKDTAKETAMETLLDSNNLPYEKLEDYIESENIFQIRYFI